MPDYIKPFKPHSNLFSYDDESLDFEDAKALSPMIDGDRVICVDGIFHANHGRIIKNRKMSHDLDKIAVISKEENVVIDFVVSILKNSKNLSSAWILFSQKNSLYTL